MVFDRIAEIIAEKLDIDKDLVKPESSFNDMHVDSLYMLEILLSVEDEFGVIIEDASKITCVADLCAFVEGGKKD